MAEKKDKATQNNSKPNDKKKQMSDKELDKVSGGTSSTIQKGWIDIRR